MTIIHRSEKIPAPHRVEYSLTYQNCKMQIYAVRSSLAPTPLQQFGERFIKCNLNGIIKWKSVLKLKGSFSGFYFIWLYDFKVFIFGIAAFARLSVLLH